MRDVSERKRLEDQARDPYHQLLQAEKLAALGQTISGVAHELNNLLATILTWAERLAQRSGRSDPTRPRNNPQRIGTRREDRPQSPDVRPQTSHDARDGQPQPGRARNTRASLMSSASATSTSSRRWRQACLRCSRSPPASTGPAQPDHQRRTGDARRSRARDADRARHDADRDAVVLEVNDDGPGVPEDVQPRIFDPFFTTKEVGKARASG